MILVKIFGIVSYRQKDHAHRKEIRKRQIESLEEQFNENHSYKH